MSREKPTHESPLLYFLPFVSTHALEALRFTLIALLRVRKRMPINCKNFLFPNELIDEVTLSCAFHYDKSCQLQPGKHVP